MVLLDGVLCIRVVFPYLDGILGVLVGIVGVLVFGKSMPAGKKSMPILLVCSGQIKAGHCFCDTIIPFYNIAVFLAFTCINGENVPCR